MAVFRVERNTGYTVMSNHHLRNKELSLKAKGLLSQMLSLPEDWDYGLKTGSLKVRTRITVVRVPAQIGKAVLLCIGFKDTLLRRDLSRWFSAKAHQKMQWGCRTLLVRQPCCNSAQICKCIAQMGIKAERLIHSLIAGSAGDGQAGKGVFFAPFLRCLCQ